MDIRNKIENFERFSSKVKSVANEIDYKEFMSFFVWDFTRYRDRRFGGDEV